MALVAVLLVVFLAAMAAGHAPAGTPNLPQWDSSRLYKPGDHAMYNASLYVATTPSTGAPPYMYHDSWKDSACYWYYGAGVWPPASNSSVVT